MFTSKSLLDSITVGKLEFDCINIVAWLRANRKAHMRGSDFPLPIESVARTAGTVTRVSGGCYGAVFKLSGYKGLILKVCFREDDGYPEFIRSVAVKHAPAWAPKIFAHGGDETKEGFWCVMPEYKEVRDPWGRRPAEATHMASAAGAYGSTEYRMNEFVRQHRKDISRTTAAMEKAGALEDMHFGNIMFDDARKHHVITDPVSRWSVSDKEAYRHAHS